MLKKAIVLGGTFPHRELITKLKNRGYYTILIDYYKSPIAKDVANEHIQESTLDKEKVVEIAKKEKVDLVIATCVDQANVTACYVGEKLGLPHPYSYKISLNVTDKVEMKRIMIENGIPTSKHITIENIAEFIDKDFSYPIIVKPADSNSSKGVRRIDKSDVNAIEYIKKALELSRNGVAIVEEYKIGKEVGVDCIIKDHKATVIMTRVRRKIQTNNDAIQQIYGSFWPADITQRQAEDLRIIAEKIAQAFDLNNTPLMMQTIVNDNGINVIEFGARIGGGENYHIIKELTGYDFIEEAIKSYLNEEISLNYQKPSFFLVDNYIYMKPGFFGEMRISEKVKDHILYTNIYRRYGASVGADISSNNRVGVFVIKIDKIDKISEKIKNIIDNMEVYDTAGNPVMRKDIY